MIFLIGSRLIPMNLLSFSERLEYAMKSEGVRPVDLANSLGTSRAAVSYLLNGQSKGMRPEHLAKTAKALNVRIEWLATGEEPMRSRQLTAQQRSLLEYSERVSPETIDAIIKLLAEASAPRISA